MSGSHIFPVIDLFAGPGGLGEGFAAFRLPNGQARFQIALSVEKEIAAHQTLELRAFFRTCKRPDISKAYDRFIRREVTREELFSAYPREAAAAQREAWRLELRPEVHREVAARVMEAVGRSEESVLIGGPPCQAYSVVGRARNAGNPHYRPKQDIRHTLYEEYLRVLSQHWPCVFVMENVKGLLSARYNEQSIFMRILDDLRDPLKALEGKHRTTANHRYRILALDSKGGEQTEIFENADDDLTRFVVKCERHGIPQRRHRVILVGIREDVFSRGKELLLRARPTTTTAQALMDLPALRSGVSDVADSADAWLSTLSGALEENWFKVLESQDAPVAAMIESAVIKATESGRQRGSEFAAGQPSPCLAPRWFKNGRIGGFSNHVTRSHMRQDLKRYLFASAFTAVHGKSPTLINFPKKLRPAHENVPEALIGGLFSDRFRVQSADFPSTTITSHISKDGHYYIHYDPSQCRSLTVREAARLQTFPDNYFFCGPRTSQYQQVGNAVPPLLALQIAAAISNYLG